MRPRRKGEVAIIHPAFESFLNFLVDEAVKQWLAEYDPATVAETDTRADDADDGVTGDHVFTVDEAVTRLGMTREAIMAEFEEIARRHKARSRVKPR
jgi:hypothetical protein